MNEVGKLQSVIRKSDAPPLLTTLPKCSASLVGLRFDEEISFEEWLAVGRQLVLLSESVQWLIGDWINWGHDRWEQLRYKVALESLPYAYGSLANMSYVAQRIEFSRRREKLSFAHHQEVAMLDRKKQSEFLTRAEKEQWSRADLREAIRKSEAEFPPEKPVKMDMGPYAHATKLHLWLVSQNLESWPDDQREFWKRELEPIVEIFQRL